MSARRRCRGRGIACIEGVWGSPKAALFWAVDPQSRLTLDMHAGPGSGDVAVPHVHPGRLTVREYLRGVMGH